MTQRRVEVAENERSGVMGFAVFSPNPAGRSVIVPAPSTEVGFENVHDQLPILKLLQRYAALVNIHVPHLTPRLDR